MARISALAAAIWLMTAGPGSAAAPYLLGFWYGTGQPDDKDNMWLEQFLPNGDFRGHYRDCIKGKPADIYLTGQWSLSGDRETIEIATVNGVSQPRTDPYQLVSNDGRIWKYRYLPRDYIFTARRVDEKFQMPDCEAIS